MANSFLDLPMPVGDGAGTSVDTSGMGTAKTIIVGGVFTGATVTVEASVDGGTVFKPVAVFSGEGKQTISVAAEFMRVFIQGRSAEPFSANCDVGANSNGMSASGALNIPSADGTGTPLDISALGLFKTFIAGGEFSGCSLTVELSEDGTSYFPCVSFFNEGSVQCKAVVANWARVQVLGKDGNVLPYTPSLAIGAADDVSNTVASHDLAGTEHNADTLANLNSKVSDATLAALGVAQQFTKNQHSLPVALVDAATVLINAPDSNVFTLTATGGVGATRELDNPSGLVAGMTWTVHFIQDGTGGRALTYDTFYDFGDEGLPDHTTDGANKYSIITCVAQSATKIAATALKGFTL